MKALDILQRFSDRCESALGFNGEYVATLGEINEAIVELEAQLANTEQLTCEDKYNTMGFTDDDMKELIDFSDEQYY